MSPIINPLVVAWCRLMLPLMMQKSFGGMLVRIAPADLDKLRQYKGQRMLLLPNHPTGEEPVVLFDIAKRLNEVFNFVAAREVFDWEHGFRGWVLRRVGAYSVIRGAADRESFMTSKKILMEGRNRLVIFIEGEISRGNETLIPFEPGVIQLAFKAQEALAKEATKQANSDYYPPVYLAPVAIKYFYLPGYNPVIEQALTHLEKAVGVTVHPEAGYYQRISVIGARVLHVQEGLHQITPPPDATFTDRVKALQSRILQKMELFLDLKPAPQSSILSRLREIRNAIDHLVHSYDDPAELTEYEHRMVEHFRLALGEFYKDLDRVVYFLTYDASYLQESRTPERYIEMIRRLEREVYGKARLNHPRITMVQVGDVMNLKEKLPVYEADKKGYVKNITDELEENMRQMIARTPNPIRASHT